MALEIKSTKLINKDTGEVLMDTTGSTFKRIGERITEPIEIDDEVAEELNKDIIIKMKSSSVKSGIKNEIINKRLFELCGINVIGKTFPEIIDELVSIWGSIEENKKEPILHILFGFSWQYLEETLDKEE